MMIKRVKPFYKKEWLENVDRYIENYDFWSEGILGEYENKMCNYIGRKYGVAINSATNGIFMALYAWRKYFKNKNEVVLTNWGYPAAYKVAIVLGLKPVAVDVDKKTLSMTAEGIKKAINGNTLAVIHIENNGIIGNAKDFKEVIPDHVLFIEDCAPSMVQEKAGTFGDVAIFSSSPTKVLMSGEGGMLLTDNEVLKNEFEALRYVHDYNDRTPCMNFMLSPFLAAYIMPQFGYLNDIINMRERVHAEYKKYIDIFEEESNRHGAIMYLSKKAQRIHEAFDRFKIQHRYKHYDLFDPSSKFPQSIEIRKEIIDLPIHHDLKDSEIEMICNIIRKVENE